MSYFFRHQDRRLAYLRQDGVAPGVLFLGGYCSDMTGTKAGFLAEQCAKTGRGFLRFDYRGHGQSEGRFRDGCIGDWFDDALAIFDACTVGAQILVGSSMGGWLALKLALARPERVVGLVGIAAAPDFTEDLLWNKLSGAARQQLERDGYLQEQAAPEAQPMIYTHNLVVEGRRHLLLRDAIALRCPVRLLQGQGDVDVPWETAIKIAAQVTAQDVRVTLIKDGDHRLNRPEDCALLWAAVQELVAITANLKAEDDQQQPD